MKVRLADVNFAVYNPRKITKEKLAELKASLVKHGMVLNLVIQRQADDGTPLVLIGGHQRVRAMRELHKEWNLQPPAACWSTVLDIKDAEAKQLNIALNNIEADFDDHLLGTVLASIRDGITDGDIAAMGFTPAGVDDLIADAMGTGEGDEDKRRQLPQVPTLSVSFATIADRDSAKGVIKRLAANGIESGKATLEALLRYERAEAPAPRRRRAAAR